jgi:hypothetical protein
MKWVGFIAYSSNINECFFVQLLNNEELVPSKFPMEARFNHTGPFENKIVADVLSLKDRVRLVKGIFKDKMDDFYEGDEAYISSFFPGKELDDIHDLLD